MMPTPSHLRECIERSDQPVDEGDFCAPVVCPCGNRQFSLLYPGETREVDGRVFPVVAAIDSKFFLVITARCTACQRDHVLLDKDLHGWNGYVCRDDEQAALPRPPLTPWKCSGCQDTPHTMVVHVYTEGAEDFIDESGGEFDPDTWPDGFGWFGLDTECATCGLKTDSLIDYETM